jgi:succinate dehydrogenase / fumarate reductase, cytochrome b subunit
MCIGNSVARSFRSTEMGTFMADNSKPSERPLSPHLQIYKPMLTMVMSILHRITGAALYVGTLILAWWLIAGATGPAAFATAQWFLGTWFGKLVLFGYTWALMHHMLGGIRHFVWDTGHGFGVREREWLAKATIAGSCVLTVLIWIVGIAMR